MKVPGICAPCLRPEPMLKCGLFHQSSSSFLPLHLSLGSLRTSEPIGASSTSISDGSFCDRAKSPSVDKAAAARRSSRKMRTNADKEPVLFLGQASPDHTHIFSILTVSRTLIAPLTFHTHMRVAQDMIGTCCTSARLSHSMFHRPLFDVPDPFP